MFTNLKLRKIMIYFILEQKLQRNTQTNIYTHGKNYFFPHGKKFGRNAALPLVLLRHYTGGQLQRSS